MSDLKINNITNKNGDTGPVIAGVSTVASTGFMAMPSGSTEMRGGSGRGVIAVGGYPANLKTCDKIEIATTGNAVNFGDLSTGGYGRGSFSSSAHCAQQTDISTSLGGPSSKLITFIESSGLK